MKSRFFLLILSVFVFSTFAIGQNWSGNPPIERRVALVIGNNAYETSPLRNTLNDARDMARTLNEMGFEITFKENLSQKEMKQAIQSFGEQIRQGGVGLFYFAGHAVQVNARDYMIPVRSRISDEDQLDGDAIELSLVLEQMQAARNSTNIVILDACRNNPFRRNSRSGPKRLTPMDAPPGTFIAYATAPGAEASDGRGRNGLYTQELLKAMRTSGLSIEEVFKRVRVGVQRLTQGRQTPWESSSLTSDFYFSRSDDTWLQGNWEGTAYQGNLRAAQPIKFAVRNNAYAIESPALGCSGEWSLLQSKNGKATLREKIANGSNRCEDGGEIVVEKVSELQLVFKYFQPSANRIVASAILNKK
jgi:Caspase domain